MGVRALRGRLFPVRFQDGYASEIGGVTPGTTRSSRRGARSTRCLTLESLEPRLFLSASTFTVTDLSDPATLTPGTFRWAVARANAYVEGTVTFAQGLAGSIQLLQGPMAISAGVTIDGPGAAALTILADSASGGVFNAISTGLDLSLSLSNLTISGATAGAVHARTSLTLSGCDFTNDVGDGAIDFATGGLTINNCDFENDQSNDAGGAIQLTGNVTANITNSNFTGCTAGEGGAIYVGSTPNTTYAALTIKDCTLKNNSATQGGAIFSLAPVDLDNSLLYENSAVDGPGGAIYMQGTWANIIGGIFTDNTAIASTAADCVGGAFYGENVDLALYYCLFSRDQAQGIDPAGGGVTITFGRCEILNSTFTADFAVTGSAVFAGTDETLSIVNSTIDGNDAQAGAAIDSTSDAKVTMNNSIVAQNNGKDCGVTLQSGSAYNLIGDGSGGLTNKTDGNIIGSKAKPVDPKLGPLANNGGVGDTMALLPGSPAINAGSNALAVEANGDAVTLDGRGDDANPRVMFETIDMGAFEYGDASAQTYIEKLYQQLLGRSASTYEVNVWTQMAFDGESYTQIASAIMGSAEFDANDVNQVYEQVLNRPADAAGSTYWVGQMQQGLSASALRASILGSAEYFATTGAGGTATNATFVTGLYQQILGRAPDAIGEAYWAALLGANSQTATQIATALLASDEAHASVINADYSAYLNRPSDPSGLSYWGSALDNGTSEKTLALDLLTSAEYLSDLGIS